jgi:hypothetical protein
VDPLRVAPLRHRRERHAFSLYLSHRIEGTRLIPAAHGFRRFRADAYSLVP